MTASVTKLPIRIANAIGFDALRIVSMARCRRGRAGVILVGAGLMSNAGARTDQSDGPRIGRGRDRWVADVGARLGRHSLW